MDAFTKGEPLEVIATKDSAVQNKEFKTDVEGVFADDTKQGMAVFNVDNNTFNQNSHFGRKRFRFPNGSNASKYMKGTKYNIPFWIRSADGYVRKIK